MLCQGAQALTAIAFVPREDAQALLMTPRDYPVSLRRGHALGTPSQGTKVLVPPGALLHGASLQLGTRATVTPERSRILF